MINIGQTYKDLVDYALCNDIDNEKLCELNDKEYQKLIDDIAFDLLFDSTFNDYMNERIEYYMNEKFKKSEEEEDYE